jgi:hypothetical protein
MRKLLVALAVSTALIVPAMAAEDLPPPDWSMDQEEFDKLPRDVRAWANDTRKSCREFGNQDLSKLSPMIGITKVIIDGKPGVLIDDAHLCGDYRVAAVNCSNRSCQFGVFRQDGKGWRKILDEPLMDSYSVVGDTATGGDPPFQLLLAAIWAGDLRCHPTKPENSYTTGRFCHVLGRYHNNAWQWEKVK